MTYKPLTTNSSLNSWLDLAYRLQEPRVSNIERWSKWLRTCDLTDNRAIIENFIHSPFHPSPYTHTIPIRLHFCRYLECGLRSSSRNVGRVSDWLTYCLTDWVIDWLTDSLNEWLIGWLFTEWMIDWLTDSLNEWLIGWLIHWMNDWLADWLTEWMFDWLTDSLTEWLIGWLIHWMNDWLADWLTEWMIDWLTD